jgi:Tol biopolymer transport system component
VILVNVDNPTTFITLTTRYGGLDYAWSPDGRRVAYSDYDANGIRQLYVSDLGQSEPIQLTRLIERGTEDEPPGNYIGKIAWSPDGNSIALHQRFIDAQGVINGSVWIVSAAGDRQVETAFANLPSVPWLAWSEDNSTIAFYSQQDGSTVVGNDVIYWVNAKNGKVQQMLSSSEVPEGWFSSAFSLLSVELLGITTYLPNINSYSYDYRSDTLSAFKLPDLLENPDFVEEVTAPASFPGEEVCKGKLH